MKIERVLVTGAAGLLGQHVVDALSDAYTVSGFDRIKGAADIPWHVGDITDSDAVAKAIRGQDAVVHLAAVPNIWSSDGETIIRVNALGTWIVLNATEEVGARRAVLCSTDSVVGYTVKEGRMIPPDYLPINHEHPVRPTDPYGLSKAICEDMGRSFSLRNRIEVLAIRPVFIAFPEMFGELKARAADPAGYRGPAVGGPSAAGGGVCWHYVDPRDAAQAFRLAIERPIKKFDAFMISAAETLAPEPTLERLEKTLGRLPEIRDPDLYARQPYAPLFDLDHAANELGFRASINLRPDLT